MSTANTAIVGDVTKNKKINDFYKKVELEYEKLINDEISIALIYKGTKR